MNTIGTHQLTLTDQGVEGDDHAKYKQQQPGPLVVQLEDLGIRDWFVGVIDLDDIVQATEHPQKHHYSVGEHILALSICVAPTTLRSRTPSATGYREGGRDVWPHFKRFVNELGCRLIFSGTECIAFG